MRQGVDMKDGFVKVAALTPPCKVADTAFNADAIAALAAEYAAKGCKLIVFPEMAVTGYTVADLLTQDALLDASDAALLSIAKKTAKSDCAVVVGAPVRADGKLYDCAVVLNGGRVVGVVPKTAIPNYGEFYEGRYFASARDAVAKEARVGAQVVPFGADLLFRCKGMPEFCFGVEICEDMWGAKSPSSELCAAGATIVCNPSASDEIVGKAEYRRLLVQAASGKGLCGYVYADAGVGESTTDAVFAGHDIIAEDAAVLAESAPFGKGAAVAVIDVFKLARERRARNTFGAAVGMREVEFECKLTETELGRKPSRTPFVPADDKGREGRCKLILAIQANALAKRITHTGAKKVVVGLSGGLDSALALLVAVDAAKISGLAPKDVLAVTMPCFGTTSRTRSNAEMLAEGLGADFKEVKIGEAVKVHLADIDHPIDLTDVTYENAQARERTQVLMDIANMCGGIVVGTGDLSEVALGWATYNGDHMSMYGVNASVPKTLIRYVVRYYAETCGNAAASRALNDILDTPISPELIPAKDGEIVQKTEEIVGSYELNDFFLYYAMRYGFRPRKVLRLAKLAFDDVNEGALKAALAKFYRRFFSQQFKRSCTPDAPKVGSVALSPRGDWKMPSDACPAAWLDDLK